ncbi:hypothetical protein Tco_0956175 [Tanacetum coccineum]|uniref:Uncharacterized protein n=1 Tax=Tanacetum coccineum TaxID=301880 RepID=A0ABQ5E992_9ASTR
MVLAAYLTGNITTLVVKGSKTTLVVKGNMDKNELGKDIRYHIKDQLMSPYDSSHTDSAVFQDLPGSRHAMVTENIYKPYIVKVPLFQRMLCWIHQSNCRHAFDLFLSIGFAMCYYLKKIEKKMPSPQDPSLSPQDPSLFKTYQALAIPWYGKRIMRSRAC